MGAPAPLGFLGNRRKGSASKWEPQRFLKIPTRAKEACVGHPLSGQVPRRSGMTGVGRPPGFEPTTFGMRFNDLRGQERAIKATEIIRQTSNRLCPPDWAPNSEGGNLYFTALLSGDSF